MREKYIDLALKSAKKSYFKDEIPVGAIVVCNGEVISKAHNLKEKTNNPLKHAEIIAIEKACKKLNSVYLNECEIYVTLEPCIMCFGAILESRIKKLVYSASNEKYGFTNFVDVGKINKKIIIEKGIFEDKSASMLKDFFKNKRE